MQSIQLLILKLSLCCITIKFVRFTDHIDAPQVIKPFNFGRNVSQTLDLTPMNAKTKPRQLKHITHNSQLKHHTSGLSASQR